MANLKLGLLGPLQINVDNALTKKFESDKARALLAYLAVESNHPHRRDTLLGLLWPDCSEEVARHNFRQTLYNLRQAIGDPKANPPYLLITRDEVQFNTASDYSLDVEDFNALLESCDKHLPQCVEACPIHAERLEKALEIYRGAFLQEFFLADSAEFEEWAIRKREELHRRALESLTYVANYYEFSSEYGAAQRYALRQLELDPWREEAHRQLMRVFAVSGQRSAALAQYETCHRMLAKELGVEPSAETRALYEQIKHEEPEVQRKEPRSALSWSAPQLPVQTTPFVGREAELEQLAKLLSGPDCRLVTLVGPGGIGKTRLALELASSLRGQFAHGVLFVPLTAIKSPAFVLSAIATATGFVFEGSNDPKVQLLRFFRGKQVLLVLDNAEDLLAEEPLECDKLELFTDILQEAPQVKILVTSRDQLNLRGEWIYEVGGLTLPESVQEDAFDRSSAVALFLQRARRARIGFAEQADEQEAIVHICQLVGGIPLAIELAAAWVRTLSCSEIAGEIERSLDFLAISLRDFPERHRSMRAVFDHSWRLLSDKEKHALSALAIFQGGFSREGAEFVAGANLPLLSSLISKSLVKRMPNGRYDLHELVRQYASAKLAQSPVELQATEERHSSYYMDFVASREKHLKSARQLETLREMGEEFENIRAAWRLAVIRRHLTSTQKQLKAFWLYYEMRGGFKEAEALLGWAAQELEAGFAARGPLEKSLEVTRASIRAHQGWFCLKLGKLEEARTLLEPSVAKLESLGAIEELVYPIHFLWALEWVAGHHARARELVLQQLEMVSQLGDPWDIAVAQGTLGRMDYIIGEYVEALAVLTKASTAFQSLGDPGMLALSLCYLGPVQLELGMLTAAQDSLRRSVELTRTLNDRWNLAKSLSYLGVLEQARENFPEAVDMLKESLAMFEEMGAGHDTITTLNALGNVMLKQGPYAEAEEFFLKALSLAREARFLPEVLEALLGIGECRINKGELATALILLVHIQSHPSSTPVTARRAQFLYSKVKSRLTPEQVEAVEARTSAESFEDVVQAVLQV